ncbi:unnamed protein product [Vitrella brassicaformis CCMP3155]|uniref:Uncharacterized protein n=2 Tax=Vitrella brassicaformis TaxID=1169539 RepID=A0A0G4EIQ7_VITBC|nr:unnamed protein product [Vitrella brassicaformis CCMP3155]|eukprot:CEL96894.1 unnamed protein product [Vitrella brassicaformis CCMP3155]
MVRLARDGFGLMCTREDGSTTSHFLALPEKLEDTATYADLERQLDTLWASCSCFSFPKGVAVFFLLFTTAMLLIAVVDFVWIGERKRVSFGPTKTILRTFGPRPDLILSILCLSNLLTACLAYFFAVKLRLSLAARLSWCLGGLFLGYPVITRLLILKHQVDRNPAYKTPSVTTLAILVALAAAVVALVFALPPEMKAQLMMRLGAMWDTIVGNAVQRHNDTATDPTHTSEL